MEDINECMICGFKTKSNNGFGSHIKQNHKIETKEYYDLYILKGNMVKCKQCDNEASFSNITKGYREHCSKSCSKKVQPNSKGWQNHKAPGYVVWNKRLPMNPEYKKNWLNAVKDTEWLNPASEETKRKLRLRFIENLKETNKKFHPPYNRKACEYFNLMMQDSDFFIQHAMNFGEFHIKELGYFVDGYDAENNIVYEWDEKRHYEDNITIEKDLRRQSQIMEYLGCKFVRIRQND
jgi:hypothetical protein